MKWLETRKTMAILCCMALVIVFMFDAITNGLNASNMGLGMILAGPLIYYFGSKINEKKDGI